MTALTKDILYDIMSTNITDFNRIYSISFLNKLLPDSVPHKMVIENNHGYGHCTRIRVIEYTHLDIKYFIQFRYSGGSCAGCDTDERDMSHLYNPAYESYKEDNDDDDETTKIKLTEEEIKEKYKKNTEIVLRNLKQKCYMAKIVTSLDDLTKPPVLNNNNNNNNNGNIDTNNNELYDEDKLNKEIDEHNKKYD
jgi:hypothetical protein